MVTSLKHRIPVRVRHYWKLLAVCGAFVTSLILLAGNLQVTPLVTSAADIKGDNVLIDFAGTVDLFDHAKPHTISVSLDAVAYDRMLDNYMATGDKEYVRADMTIDGTAIPDVGLRLKGNSTLSALTHEGRTRTRGGPGAIQIPGGGQFPGGQIPGGQIPGGGQFPGGAPRDPNAPGGGPRDPSVPGSAPREPNASGGAVNPSGGALRPTTSSGAVQPAATPARSGQGPSAQPTPTPSRGQPGGNTRVGGGGRSPLDSAKPEELPWLISFDEFVKGRRYQGRAELAVRVSGMNGSLVMNEALSLDLLAQAGETTQRYTYASFRVNDRPVRARLIVEHPDTSFATSLGTGVLYKSLATNRFSYQGEDPTAYEDDFKQVNGKGSYDIKPVIDLIQWVNDSSDADFIAHLADHLDVPSFARYVAAQSLLLNFDDMSGPGHNYFLWYDLTSKKFKVLSWDHNLTFTSIGGPPPNGGTIIRGPVGGGPRAGHILKERFLAASAFKPVYDAAYADLKQKFFGNGAATSTLDAIVATLRAVEGADPATVTGDADRLRPLLQPN